MQDSSVTSVACEWRQQASECTSEESEQVACFSLVSRIGGFFIPTIFRHISSRATAGQSEGCYPRENIGPGGNVSPVLHDYSLGADTRIHAQFPD